MNTLITLDVEGKVLTWNASARTILGYVADEIVGQPVARLYAAADVAAALGDALARGRHEETGRLICKDGTRLDVQSVFIPLYDAREKHVGFGGLLNAEAVHAKAAAASAAAAPATAGPQILVVDDDDQIRRIAVRQLTGLGYRVREAPGGVEALAILGEGVDIDLLFVDMSMPGMDGNAVAEKAVALRPGLRILFASGNFEGGAQAGAWFLMKPYRKSELAEKVREALSASPP
ncbi:MAG TPA: response regulator [Reyranella sp.]|nr:response regulator [Reyranella sp.]